MFPHRCVRYVITLGEATMGIKTPSRAQQHLSSLASMYVSGITFRGGGDNIHYFSNSTSPYGNWLCYQISKLLVVRVPQCHYYETTCSTIRVCYVMASSSCTASRFPVWFRMSYLSALSEVDYQFPKQYSNILSIKLYRQYTFNTEPGQSTSLKLLCRRL